MLINHWNNHQSLKYLSIIEILINHWNTHQSLKYSSFTEILINHWNTHQSLKYSSIIEILINHWNTHLSSEIFIIYWNTLLCVEVLVYYNYIQYAKERGEGGERLVKEKGGEEKDGGGVWRKEGVNNAVWKLDFCEGTREKSWNSIMFKSCIHYYITW